MRWTITYLLLAVLVFGVPLLACASCYPRDPATAVSTPMMWLQYAGTLLRSL